MSVTLAAPDSKGAQAVPISGVLPLDGTSDAWRLVQGRAHVFAIELRDGEPAAPRRFLFSLEAPAAIFGIGARRAGARFEARLDADAGAEPLVLQGGEGAEAAAAAADAWLKGWLDGLTDLLQGAPPRDVVSHRDATTVEAGRVLSASQALVWCEALTGAGALFDLIPVNSSGGAAGLRRFPLGEGAWVRTFTPLDIACTTSLQLLEVGALHAALAEFNAAGARAVETALGLARLDQARRRERRQTRLASDTRRLLGDLARMVGAEAPARADKAADQPLFSAVYRVAARLGVRAQTPSSVRQSDADAEPSLNEILRASGLRARPVRLTEGWRRGVDDMVGFAGEERRPVALLRDRRGRYCVQDPESGASTPADGQGGARLATDAWVLYQPLPDKPLKLNDLLFFGLRGSGTDLAVIGAAALLSAVLGSTPAIAAKSIFDTLIPQRQTGLLLQAGAALAVFAVISAVFIYSGNVAMTRIRGRASTRLKAALWDRVLRQPMAFLGRFTAPDLTLRVSTAENIVSTFHAMAQQSVVTLGMLLTNVVTMIWLSPPAAAAGVGLLASLGAVTWLAAWAQKRAFTGGEQAEGSTSTFVHAITNGVRKLRLAGAEERAFVKWGDRFTRSRLKLINVRRVTNGFSVFLAAFNIAALAAVLWVVAKLSKVEMGSGALFGFVTAFGVALSALASLGRVALQLAFQTASVPYIQPLLDTPPPAEAKKSHPGRLSGAVEVSNLHFRYPDGTAALSGVSFSAHPGEFVAVVGPSGCGKSTLVKLLLGLEAPLAGAVLYDRRDLASLDVEAVRGQVGVVMQRAQLMATSIFENLRGTTEASLDEVWEAARLAGIDEDIRAMPMGMYTLISDGAQTISGGQKQRLALARALVRRPALLILDEATSALDNLTQGEVMGNLAQLACTRIVIAHRLSTVMKADQILVLDDGRVVETGAYDELVSMGGTFARMAARQSADAV